MRPHLTPPMRTRMVKNPFFPAFCAATVLLASCGRGDASAVNSEPVESGAAAAPAALTVTTAAVHSQELERTVPATGSIHPWQEVIIGPEVGGYRVAEVLVDVGSRVRQGQVLV